MYTEQPIDLKDMQHPYREERFLWVSQENDISIQQLYDTGRTCNCVKGVRGSGNKNGKIE